MNRPNIDMLVERNVLEYSLLIVHHLFGLHDHDLFQYSYQGTEIIFASCCQMCWSLTIWLQSKIFNSGHREIIPELLRVSLIENMKLTESLFSSVRCWLNMHSSAYWTSIHVVIAHPHSFLHPLNTILHHHSIQKLASYNNSPPTRPSPWSTSIDFPPLHPSLVQKCCLHTQTCPLSAWHQAFCAKRRRWQWTFLMRWV